MIKLIGMDTADQMLNDIWGDSVLQAVNDAVKMCGLVTGSLATLVAELKVDVIKIPELKSILSTAAGEQQDAGAVLGGERREVGDQHDHDRRQRGVAADSGAVSRACPRR